jgi:hypothetical protein
MIFFTNGQLLLKFWTSNFSFSNSLYEQWHQSAELNYTLVNQLCISQTQRMITSYVESYFVHGKLWLTVEKNDRFQLDAWCFNSMQGKPWSWSAERLRCLATYTMLARGVNIYAENCLGIFGSEVTDYCNLHSHICGDTYPRITEYTKYSTEDCICLSAAYLPLIR